MDNITGVMEDFNASNQSANIQGFIGFTAASLLKAASVLDFFYTPLVCLFGVVGNCLSVIVFCKNGSHRQLSSAFYLSALAISDTGFLLNLFAFWLDGMANGMILSTNLGCPLIMYTGQVFCFLSVWLTVGFTVERYFAVCSPLTRPIVCTVSKAKKVTVGLTATAVIIFSYVLIIARALPKDEVFSQFRDNQAYDQTSSSLLDKLHNITIPNASFLGTSQFDIISQEGFVSTDKLPLQRQVGGGSRNLREDAGVLPLLESSSEWDYTDDVRAEYPNGNSLSHAESDNRLSHGFRNKLHESQALDPKQEFLKGSEILRRDSEGSPPSTSTTEFYESVQMNEVVEESTDDSSPRNSPSPTRLICTVPTQFLTVSIIANYIDSMITLIIPFCLIAYFNMRITLCVMKLKEERKKIVAAFNMMENDGGSKRKEDGSDSNNSQSSLEEDNEVEKKVSNFSKSSFPLKRVNGQRRKSTKNLAQEIIGRESIKRIKWKDSVVSPPSRRNNGGHSRKNDQSLGKNISHRQCNGESGGNYFKDNYSCDFRCSCNTYLFEDSVGRNKKKFVSCNSQNCPATKSSSRTRTVEIKKKSLILNCMRGTAVQWGRDTSVSSHGMKFRTGNKILLNGQSSSMESRQRPLVRSSHVSSSETRVTKMLLLVSSVFLLLNLPSHAIRAAAFIENLVWKDDREGQKMLHAAQQLSNILLFNTNFAVNFLLYCLSGKNFRQSLRQVFLGARKQNSARVKSIRFTPSIKCKTSSVGRGESSGKNESTVVFDDDEIETEFQHADLWNQI